MNVFAIQELCFWAQAELAQSKCFSSLQNRLGLWKPEAELLHYFELVAGATRMTPNKCHSE
jgi:hypothetical protein